MCRRVTLRRPERKGQLVAKRSPVQSGVRKVVDAPQRSLSFIIDTQVTQGIGVQVHIRTVSMS